MGLGDIGRVPTFITRLSLDLGDLLIALSGAFSPSASMAAHFKLAT